MTPLAILPDWNSLDAVRSAHSDLEAAGLVCFALLVIMETLAHIATDEKRKHIFDSVGIWFFAIAVICEIAGYWYGLRNDDLAAQVIGSLDFKAQKAADNASKALNDSKDAEDKSGDAAGKAERANDASSNAVSVARSARKEADSFEHDIASAKAELIRIRTPRSIPNETALISALKPFSGTEYVLNVSQDDESIEFIKTINRVLSEAGWVRIPSIISLGIPSYQIPSVDEKSGIPICAEDGIQLHIREEHSPDFFETIPLDQLPKGLRAAIALKLVLPPFILPSDNRNVGEKVLLDRQLGAETPMRVCVGRKP